MPQMQQQNIQNKDFQHFFEQAYNDLKQKDFAEIVQKVKDVMYPLLSMSLSDEKLKSWLFHQAPLTITQPNNVFIAFAGQDNRIYLNPVLMVALSDYVPHKMKSNNEVENVKLISEAVGSIIIHEIMHILLGHTFKMESIIKNFANKTDIPEEIIHKMANIVMDYIINCHICYNIFPEVHDKKILDFGIITQEQMFESLSHFAVDIEKLKQDFESIDKVDGIENKTWEELLAIVLKHVDKDKLKQMFQNQNFNKQCKKQGGMCGIGIGSGSNSNSSSSLNPNDITPEQLQQLEKIVDQISQAISSGKLKNINDVKNFIKPIIHNQQKQQNQNQNQNQNQKSQSINQADLDRLNNKLEKLKSQLKNLPSTQKSNKVNQNQDNQSETNMSEQQNLTSGQNMHDQISNSQGQSNNQNNQMQSNQTDNPMLDNIIKSLQEINSMLNNRSNTGNNIKILKDVHGNTYEVNDYQDIVNGFLDELGIDASDMENLTAEQMQDVMRKLSASLSTKMKQAGYGRGSILRELMDNLNVNKRDMETILTRFLKKVFGNDIIESTWCRINRRMPNVVPGQNRYAKKRDFIVFFDVSGSIGEREANIIASSLKFLVKNRLINKLVIHTFDDGLIDTFVIEDLKDFEKFKRNTKGCGGTSLVEAFKHDNVKIKNNTVVAVFTDSVVSDDKDELAKEIKQIYKKTRTPVLWFSVYNGSDFYKIIDLSGQALFPVYTDFVKEEIRYINKSKNTSKISLSTTPP